MSRVIFNRWRWGMYGKGHCTLSEQDGWYALEERYRAKILALVEEEADLMDPVLSAKLLAIVAEFKPGE